MDKAGSIALSLLATMRLTRLVVKDDLGLWLVVAPLTKWASSYEPALPPPWEERDEKPPGWRIRAVSGLDCPFCVGYWIGAGVLGTQAMCSRFTTTRRAWTFVAATLALNEVAGHLATRLGDA